ncbi:MAG: nucleotidyl transferase AbiEii/AbiGii toxin family protein [Stellaceae bacterium]
MHREVLTDTAAPLFGFLGRFPGFYLAGGTALALQLGHRISVDCDLFSDLNIDKALLSRVRRVFPDTTLSGRHEERPALSAARFSRAGARAAAATAATHG